MHTQLLLNIVERLDMNITDDCKKFLGLPPYDDYSNVVVSDPHYYQDLCNKYGKQQIDNTCCLLLKNKNEGA